MILINMQEMTNVTKDIVKIVRLNQHIAAIKDWLSAPDSLTNANRTR
jgi:hypothetical protein